LLAKQVGTFVVAFFPSKFVKRDGHLAGRDFITNVIRQLLALNFSVARDERSDKVFATIHIASDGAKGGQQHRELIQLVAFNDR
jgi:hypothetical protein